MTWVSLFCGIAFILLFVVGLVNAKSRATARQLEIAARAYALAASSEVVVLGIRIFQDAWIMAALSAFTFLAAVACAYVTARRRDLAVRRGGEVR